MTDSGRTRILGAIAGDGTGAAGVAALGCVAAATLTYVSITYGPAPTAALSTARGLAVVLAAAALLFVARAPRVVLVVLAAFVYLNLSEVLVRYHAWPSLLQLIVVPLALVSLVVNSRVPWGRLL
jgi:hypothetical protein